MEVRAGYKQSEVGVIPDDWKLEYIENLAHITTGSRNTQDRIADGEYPFFVRSQTVERINSYSFDGEAVLTAGDGVGTGKIFHYINGQFDTHQRVYRISNFCDQVNGFYFYLYFSTHFYNRIMQMTAKSSVNSVRREMIARMLVPLPPTVAEQRRIVDALRDVDALLDGLDLLIAKKRDLRQAAIQQLLTGKTRLHGFDGEWETRRLGDLATIKDGTHQTPKYVESGIPFYSVEHITSDDFTNTKLISDEEHRFLTRSVKIEKGDILMTRIGSIGVCKLIDWDVKASFYVSLALIKVKAGSSASFISHYSRTDSFKTEVELHSLQSAIPKKINLGPISDVRIKLPPTLAEQTAVAEVITDMDTELSALEQRRKKTCSLKQGVIQELLTGRIKLI